jgi:hypothetical protein
VARFLYAKTDQAPRFPELLQAHGVTTVSFASVNFLASDYGVVRGFDEETVIPKDRRHARAKEMIDPLVNRLLRAGPEPLFLFTHLTEPHFPYDRGGTDGTVWERYLQEINVADAQISRVVRVLADRFRGRGYLIVSSDHGEAFGDHDTTFHTKTLYQELLHVPLFVEGPGVVPRSVSERVSLLDIAPTILELFGVETPGAMVGESLMPILTGGPLGLLERPIIAEGRLRRALFRGSTKVIEDSRRKHVEAYDLATDPHELDNVFDEHPPDSDLAVATLRAFLRIREAAGPGYRTPYKP